MAEAVDSVPSGASVPQVKARMFGKTKSVHGILGGAQAADVLLWRKWEISGGILGVAACAWGVFEWSGYTLLTLLANAALALVVCTFIWAKAASFFGKAPPNLTQYQLSEEHVQWAGNKIRTEYNKALGHAHRVTLGDDLWLLAKTLLGLYVLKVVGGWFNSLTLFFLSVVFAFTIPVFYEKYEDQVDAHLKKGLDELHKLYVTGQTKAKALLQKIPHGEKAKKVQ